MIITFILHRNRNKRRFKTVTTTDMGNLFNEKLILCLGRFDKSE